MREGERAIKHDDAQKSYPSPPPAQGSSPQNQRGVSTGRGVVLSCPAPVDRTLDYTARRDELHDIEPVEMVLAVEKLKASSRPRGRGGHKRRSSRQPHLRPQPPARDSPTRPASIRRGGLGLARWPPLEGHRRVAHEGRVDRSAGTSIPGGISVVDQHPADSPASCRLPVNARL